jgi:hypothetical protein
VVFRVIAALRWYRKFRNFLKEQFLSCERLLRVLAWTADELYGHDGAFLDGLDERGDAFAVEIPPHAHVWLKKPKVLKKPQQNSRKVTPQKSPPTTT